MIGFIGRQARWALFMVPTVLFGCGADQATVDVSFMTRRSFLFSETARVLAYEVPPGEVLCGELRRAVELGNFGSPVLDSSARPVCDLFQGNVVFEDVPQGQLAFVGVSMDFDGALLTLGCNQWDLHQDGNVVKLSLGHQDAFTTRYNEASHPCGSPEAKCMNTCGVGDGGT